MELLTIKEVASALRVSTVTVRRYVAAGTLPAVRVGRAIRIDRQAVESFAVPVDGSSNGDSEANDVGTLLDADSPFWGIVGIIDDEGPSDVSANTDSYLVHAYSEDRER